MNRISLKQQIITDLLKAIGHLRYSFAKVKKIDLTRTQWTEEELEVLESFASRFARTSDIFVSRYLRFLIHDWDPAFRGSFIDLLNMSEKFEVIQSASKWFRIRELRNVAAHGYAADEFKSLYSELVTLTPEILSIEAGLRDSLK
jgi:hypothetical protein